MSRNANRSRKQPAMWESVARGAVAGLVGGTTLIVAHRVLLPRFPDRKRAGVNPWDKRIARAADATGMRMSPAARTITGIATQLASAVAVGVAYTVMAEQTRPSRAAKQVLDAGLVYAASLFAPELEKRRPPRRRKAKLRRRAAEAITAPAVYSRATTLTLRALAR